jgi:hypothetical protein
VEWSGVHAAKSESERKKERRKEGKKERRKEGRKAPPSLSLSLSLSLSSFLFVLNRLGRKVRRRRSGTRPTTSLTRKGAPTLKTEQGGRRTRRRGIERGTSRTCLPVITRMDEEEEEEEEEAGEAEEM